MTMTLTKWRWILALALLLPATAFSQSRAGPTALSAAATTTCLAPLNTSFLTLVVQPSTGAVTFSIGANASGNTVSFFGSGSQDANGNPVWVALSATPSNSTTAVTTSTSANVVYQANVAGYTNVCAEISTLISGTTTVTVNLGQQAARANGGGGGGGGVTSFTGDGSLITNSASTGAVTVTLGGNTQYGILTGGGAGTAPVALAPPTTAAQNGVPYILEQSPSSGAAAAATLSLPGVPIDARTTTTEAVAATDRGEVITLSNAGAIALSLIQAGTSFATNNLNFGACAIGAGAVTLTPATSTINGGATLVIPANRCAYVYSDNSNYYASETPYGNNFPSGTPAESSITGSTAATSITETGTGDAITRAGVETGNLTAPQVVENTNSTNNNTSIGLIAGAAGTSTGGIGELVFDVSGTGDIMRWYTGGSVSAGVYTVGTLEANITNAGNGVFLGTVSAGSSPPTCTPGTGGGLCMTEGTAVSKTSAVDSIYADSTTHTILANTNNFLGGAAGTGGTGLFPIQINALSTYILSATLSVNDTIVLCNKGTAITLTLPTTGIPIGKVYRIKEIGAGACTITPSSGNLDGATTLVLTQLYTAIDAAWDGTQWWIF